MTTARSTLTNDKSPVLPPKEAKLMSSAAVRVNLAVYLLLGLSGAVEPPQHHKRTRDSLFAQP